MFFPVKKIKQNIEKILLERSKLKNNWFFWSKNITNINKLSVDDANLIEDIMDLYETAEKLNNNELLLYLEQKVMDLNTYLQIINSKIKSSEILISDFQKRLLDEIILKLQKISKKTKISKINPLFEYFIKENIERRNFVFYRAEHMSKYPRLESMPGQFGIGVYFTLSIDIAKKFRSKPSCIFKFFISPKIFLEELKPIFISKEEIIPFENLDPAEFQDHLYNRGYGDKRFCVIGHIPELNYVIQIMIEKDALEELMDNCDLKWKKIEEFNL